MIDSQNVKDVIGLSPMQQSMLFEYIRTDGQDQYFEQIDIKIKGTVIVPAFKQAWQWVVDHHDILRTAFWWEGIRQPIQIIYKHVTVQIIYYDLSAEERIQKEQKLEELKAEKIKNGFHLKEVPFFIILCKFAEDHYHMILNNHHILFDGWSNPLLLNNFIECYLKIYKNYPLSIQTDSHYKEYIKYLQSYSEEYGKEFWRHYLKDYTISYSLLKELNGEEQTYGLREQIFPDHLLEQIRLYSMKEGVTLAAILYLAWGLCLQKFYFKDDITFGTVVSGRNIPIKNIEQVIGLFINTIPLRVISNEDMKLTDLLIQLNEHLKARTEFEQIPLTKIKQWMDCPHLTELFQTVMVIENYPVNLSSINTNELLLLEQVENNKWKTNFDLTIEVRLLHRNEIHIVYKETQFTAQMVNELMENFIDFINKITVAGDYYIDTLLYSSDAKMTPLEITFDLD